MGGIYLPQSICEFVCVGVCQCVYESRCVHVHVCACVHKRKCVPYCTRLYTPGGVLYNLGIIIILLHGIIASLVIDYVFS